MTRWKRLAYLSMAGLFLLAGRQDLVHAEKLSRYLYVAQPGIRNYTQYGGHGVIVFDIDNGYKFVKRIAMPGLTNDGKPLNVKGVCGNAKTGRLYVSTIRHLICLDLRTDRVLWEKTYPLGCDRMSMYGNAR